MAQWGMAQWEMAQWEMAQWGNNTAMREKHLSKSNHLVNRRQFGNLMLGTMGLLVAGCQRVTTLFSKREAGRGDLATTAPTEEAANSLFSFFASEPLPEATLRIAFDNPPLQWEPATFATVPGYQLGYALFDGLTRVDQNLAVQPALATAWQVAPDGLSWTFTLRQEVEFHHGTAFTAEDVIYTFTRLQDPAVESPLRSLFSFIDQVEIVDDGSETGSVRFLLNSPNADLPYLLGAPQALIVAHNFEPNLFATEPSGTGPFRFASSIPNERVVLQRNGRYWDQESVLLEEIQHVYIGDIAVQLEALKAGEVDLVPDISAEQTASLADHATITVLESVGGSYQTVVMQATEEPFTDVRVRRALKLCLDREQIQAMVLQGKGEIAHDHPVASFSEFFVNISSPPADIEEARMLLAEAGYPNGIKLDLITSTSQSGMLELAQVVQTLARAAGFEIEPTPVPSDVYWSTYWRNVPFHIGSWNFRPSIDETFSIAYHSTAQWNEGNWSNPDFDELIDAARSESDLAQRKALYKQAQKLLMEDGAVVIPYFRPLFTAAHKRLEGFQPHPAGWLDLRGVVAAAA